MVGIKQITGVLLMAWACSAKPSELAIGDISNTTIYENRETRAMRCTYLENYVKLCKDTGVQWERWDRYEMNYEHFYNDLPSTGSYTRYSFCSGAGPCAAMATLTGSKFTPKDYQSVARKGFNILRDKFNCYYDDYKLYNLAMDLYMEEYNFVFTWWWEYHPGKAERCIPKSLSLVADAK